MKKRKNEKPKMTMRTLHYYWQIIKKYKFRAIGSIILTPVVVFVRSTLSALVFADMIDLVSSSNGDFEAISADLITKGILLLAIYLAGEILGWIRIYPLLWRFELRANYDLATMCFNAVNEQSMQFHSDRFSGSLVSQTNKFVSAFERLFDTFVFDILTILTTVLGVFFVLLLRAPLFAFIILAIVICYSLIAYFSFRNVRKYNSAEAAAQNRQTGQLSDSISNILSVKSYGREEHERRRYANFSRGSYNAGSDVLRVSSTRNLGFSLINIAIVGAIIVFLIIGSPVFGLTISTLILIVNYSMTIMGRLWDINHIFRSINRVFGDAYEMTVILDTKNIVEDARGAKDLRVRKGDIKFKKIAFQHADAKQTIFNDFNLEIKPGEKVGLVGLSGSGKTTLTKLLLRFADVQAGEILIDGQNISKVTQRSLRENIAYVPQETALFHRSIAENIAYGKPDATEKEVRRAAKLANADEFIAALPEGYEAMVGERGTKLSGGQRQRIAIARAILKDAPILVLDEATSALDSKSEALIQEALEKLMQGRTSIVVAHRLSTIANMDRILVLDDGKIVEQGSHRALLKKGGSYAKLWSRQSGAFMDADS